MKSSSVQKFPKLFFFGYETANWDERQSLARRKLISLRLLWVAKAPSSAQLETVIHEDVSVEDLFSVSIETLYKHSGYTNYLCFLYLGYRKVGEQWKIPLLWIVFWEMVQCFVTYYFSVNTHSWGLCLPSCTHENFNNAQNNFRSIQYRSGVVPNSEPRQIITLLESVD